jgi:DNA-binding transcriptional MerR regulator
MAEETLYTLRQVAAELGLPESTVRFYRDAFLDHVPFVGLGRRRRYPAAAVAVLRSVAEGYAAGRSREQMLSAMEGSPVHDAAVAGVSTGGARHPSAAVTNLELLAAIVDGEREQRVALWQMAEELARLTEVLDGQEQVLIDIADRAGVTVPSRPVLEAASAPPPDALGVGRLPPSAAASAGPRPPGFAADARGRPRPPEARPAGSHEAPATEAASEMARLLAELESERQLVDRLREAKLKLEHRVSDAEAALEDRRGRRRGSVLGRILGPGEKV